MKSSVAKYRIMPNIGVISSQQTVRARID